MAVDLHNKDLLPSYNSVSTTTTTTTTTIPVKQQNWLALFSGYDSSKSELNSPVESELGSTETDTSSSEAEEEEEEGGGGEEDNYMTELTRQMTHYMFQDDEQSKIWDFAGEQSPPLNTIMGEFEKMKINNNSGSSFTTPIIDHSNQNLGLKPNKVVSDEQIRANEFYRLKQEQVMKQHQSMYKKNHVSVSQNIESKQHPRDFRKVRSFNNNGLSKPQKGQWPAMQQQHTNIVNGSGMRAVFLNGSSSGGTGVFLPRGADNSSVSRKKSGCSTVLIPARVLQALELHFDKVDSTSRSNSPSFPLHRDPLIGGRNNMYVQQEAQMPASNHQDIGLPQEWTY
ncbi:hypothetical protein ACFE04_012713 [Oxalis oulophora]